MTADCGTKRCRKCGRAKLLMYFHKHMNTADGRMHVCILCKTGSFEPKEEEESKESDIAALLRGWRKPE